MVLIRVLAVIGVLVMTGAILFGSTSGDFRAEGGQILALAWGKVTLIDLYVGLALFGAWVAMREDSWVTTILWWAALIVLGNLATSLYVAFAAFRSDTPRELMMGRPNPT